jgi:hypothetical protein
LARYRLPRVPGENRLRPDSLDDRMFVACAHGPRLVLKSSVAGQLMHPTRQRLALSMPQWLLETDDGGGRVFGDALHPPLDADEVSAADLERAACVLSAEVWANPAALAEAIRASMMPPRYLLAANAVARNLAALANSAATAQLHDAGGGPFRADGVRHARFNPEAWQQLTEERAPATAEVFAAARSAGVPVKQLAGKATRARQAARDAGVVLPADSWRPARAKPADAARLFGGDRAAADGALRARHDFKVALQQAGVEFTVAPSQPRSGDADDDWSWETAVGQVSTAPEAFLGAVSAARRDGCRATAAHRVCCEVWREGKPKQALTALQLGPRVSRRERR